MVTQKQSHANEVYGCPYVKKPVSVLMQFRGKRVVVILQVSLCYLLSLNMLGKLCLIFFLLEVRWKSQKFRVWVYTFIPE